MVLNYLHELQYPIGEIILSMGAFICVWVGHKFSKIWGAVKAASEKKKMKTAHLSIQTDLQSAWENEKKKLTETIVELEGVAKQNEARIEDYRMKISGLGAFSFNSDKKRNNILYSLLLENETLEQLILKAHEENTDQRIHHFKDRLRDIKKRQRLIAELFNDEKIKTHVENIVAHEISSKTTDAT